MLVITHYQRLLDYIKPDRVHVLAGRRIVASGGPELALELEENGYDQLPRRPHEPGRRHTRPRRHRAARQARRGLALDATCAA